MKLLLRCGLLAALIFLALTSAQAQPWLNGSPLSDNPWPAPVSASVGELSLSITTGRRSASGLPQSVIVRLTNLSPHDLLLPAPHEDCSDGMYGTMFIRVLVSKPMPTISSTGCVADYVFGKQLVENRIRNWHRLAPGQSLRFERVLEPQIRTRPQGSYTPIKYTYSAAYSPPYLSEQDGKLLTSAHIAYPQSKLETPTKVYKTR